jgi:hypothetical protein
MSKKNFIALANALKPVLSELTPNVLEAITGFCKSQNYNFNEARFLGYLKGECGPNGGKRKES